MSQGPSNNPTPSPAPQPEKPLLELQTAFARANPGSHEVKTDSDPRFRDVQELSRTAMFNIHSEAEGFFKINIGAEGVFSDASKTFEVQTLSRRATDEQAAILYSLNVYTPSYDERSAPTKAFYLPQWQTLHPEILRMLGRPDQQIGEGPKKTSVAVGQSYQEGDDGIVRTRVGLMFRTDEAGRLETRVLWSTPAFLEVATRLEASFKEIVGGRTRSAEPEQSAIDRQKLGNRRGGSAARSSGGDLPDGIKPLDLETFIDRCPNYLAGLIAREITERVSRDSRDQELIREPMTYIREIKLRENWDIGVKMIIGGEARELVVSKRNPESLSFDWADETAAVTDFSDADIGMPSAFRPPTELPISPPNTESPVKLDDVGFPMAKIPPGHTVKPNGKDEAA